jgi:hypothetical protein
MSAKEFFLDVAHALTGCQLVEQELKLYITEALALVHKCVGNRMVFKMTGDDYENTSLEGLIKIFGKLSDNSTLLKDLNKFKDERNFLSHQGISHCLDLEDELFIHSAVEYQPRLNAIRPEAERLRAEIREEAGKIHIHLYYDDLAK